MAQDNLKTTPRRYQETPTLQRLPEYGRKKDLETAQGDPSKREPQQNQNGKNTLVPHKPLWNRQVAGLDLKRPRTHPMKGPAEPRGQS